MTFGYTKVYVDDVGNAVGEMGDPRRRTAWSCWVIRTRWRGGFRCAWRMASSFGSRGCGCQRAAGRVLTVAVAPLRGHGRGLRFVVVGATEEESASSKGARLIHDRFLIEGSPDAGAPRQAKQAGRA